MLQAERKHRSHEAEVQAYQHDWQQHVLRLKDYFERQGLQNADPSGERAGACHPCWHAYLPWRQHLSCAAFHWSYQMACKTAVPCTDPGSYSRFRHVAENLQLELVCYGSLPEPLQPKQSSIFNGLPACLPLQ